MKLKHAKFRSADLVLVAGRHFRCPECGADATLAIPVTRSPRCECCGYFPTIPVNGRDGERPPS